MSIRLSVFFFFSSRRRHTRFDCDWSSDVCSSDLLQGGVEISVGALLNLRVAALRDERRQPADLEIASDHNEDVGVIELEDEARLRLDEVRVLEIGRASCRERV